MKMTENAILRNITFSYFTLSNFLLTNNYTNNGSDTSYKLTMSSPLHINH